MVTVLTDNGGSIDKVYNSPDLVGPTIINLRGTGNVSMSLENEPLEYGGLYRMYSVRAY